MRSESIARVGLTLLILYLFSLATSTTISFRYFGVGVIGFSLLIWFAIRTLKGWKWHRTALDPVFPLWAIAFAMSIFANDETWRRSVIALWYMGLYLAMWYVLNDVLANRGIRREVIVDAYLLASTMIIFFGYFQLRFIGFNFLTGVKRPVSILGNANILGAYLIVMLLLIAGRLWAVRDRIGRRALWLYFVLTAFLMLATYSRGSWIATASGFGVMAFFWLRESDGAWTTKLRGWVKHNGTPAIITSIGLLLMIGVFGLMFVQSLSRPGRTVSRRIILWQSAVEAFQERPITGHGLYTFGQEYMRLESIPPETPHNHAHSLVLHVAAELGVLGLTVLGLTVFMLFRAISANCRHAPSYERGLIYGSAAAILGMVVHQVIDMPVQFLTIAMLGMGTLALAAAPVNPQVIEARWRKTIMQVGSVVLSLILIGTGVWSVSVMAEYERIREMPFGANGTGDYRTAADEMMRVVDADPGLTWYSNQQGFLYGLAAYEGDSSAIAPAISAYERFLETDPQNAITLVNVAALQWQDGQQQAAVQTMQQAVIEAPDAWQFWLNLGLYAEEVGDEALAREAYTEALNDQSYLHPAWQETPLRQTIHNSYSPSGFVQVVTALSEGEFDSAIDVNSLYVERGFEPKDSQVLHLALEALVALETDDFDTANRLLDTAGSRLTSETHLMWYLLADIQLSNRIGDTERATESLDELRDLIDIQYNERDYLKGIIIPHLQYQRTTILRQFLPQVSFPAIDPILMALIQSKYPDVLEPN